jgi:transporter family-2 protein
VNVFPLWALTAGAAIAIQAAMNSSLGVLLKNPMLATSIAFLVSFVLTIAVFLLSTNQFPQMADVKSVPWYLWGAGGVLSAFGVSMFYYLIPKMGVGPMMSYALSAQIIVAIFASHFGWFGMPIKPITLIKVTGAIVLIIGVLLLNSEPSHGL